MCLGFARVADWVTFYSISVFSTQPYIIRDHVIKIMNMLQTLKCNQ